MCEEVSGIKLAILILAIKIERFNREIHVFSSINLYRRANLRQRRFSSPSVALSACESSSYLLMRKSLATECIQTAMTTWFVEALHNDYNSHPTFFKITNNNAVEFIIIMTITVSLINDTNTVNYHYSPKGFNC